MEGEKPSLEETGQPQPNKDEVTPTEPTNDPGPDARYPGPLGVRVPDFNIKYPGSETKVPEPARYPRQDVTAPERSVHYPGQDVQTPEPARYSRPDVKAPERQAHYPGGPSAEVLNHPRVQQLKQEQVTALLSLRDSFSEQIQMAEQQHQNSPAELDSALQELSKQQAEAEAKLKQGYQERLSQLLDELK